jgi:hypothetical protein
MAGTLIAHVGAEYIDRAGLKALDPSATETWTPIPHHELVTALERQLKARGLTITKEQSLNVSDLGVGCRWCIHARVGLDEHPLFARDWLDNVRTGAAVQPVLTRYKRREIARSRLRSSLA